MSHLHQPPTLSLLQLVSEHGISATTNPSSTSPLLREKQQGFNGSESLGNIFSVNLVEKLRSLGLYKVVARGLVDSVRKERADSHNSPP